MAGKRERRSIVVAATKDYFGVNPGVGIVDRIQKAIFARGIPSLTDEKERQIAYRVRDNLTDSVYRATFKV